MQQFNPRESNLFNIANLLMARSSPAPSSGSSPEHFTIFSFSGFRIFFRQDTRHKSRANERYKGIRKYSRGQMWEGDMEDTTRRSLEGQFSGHARQFPFQAVHLPVCKHQAVRTKEFTGLDGSGSTRRKASCQRIMGETDIHSCREPPKSVIISVKGLYIF